MIHRTEEVNCESRGNALRCRRNASNLIKRTTFGKKQTNCVSMYSTHNIICDKSVGMKAEVYGSVRNEEESMESYRIQY